MSTFDKLTALGVRLSLTPGGAIQATGLKVLHAEAADEARDLIRQNKPALLRELAQRAGVRLCANCGKPLPPDAGPHVRCCCGGCFAGAGRRWRGGRLVHAETGWVS